MGVDEEALDGHFITRRYADGTFIRIMIRRTTAEQYPSGWRYALHYGTVDPDDSDLPTSSDGTIRRYDNAHEDTKGHELHVASDPEPVTVEFPGMIELYERFWAEIPKQRIDP